ncbi:TetR/AcrR family transcriptional regulator [Nocardia uniformis]|uniref:TetR/AcrR family transcriptional regulator n=1 Tax=Nocardia uniformis TaxID=53432 RepID=A0A849C529_9NOCA|nr:TetR/AcrR family transcriptional regulator [Nocardia uniformis]NNH72766.1 TetR/AcrR family transcriptional regulator [Nocardia uniformis]
MTITGSRKRGRPADPDLIARRRAALIDAAAEVFADVGYTNAAVSTIADRAGLGKGTFYQYFDSKKDVLDGVIDQVVDDVTALILAETGAQRATSLDDLEGGLRTVASRLFEMTDERPQAVRMLLEGIQDEDIKERLLGLSAALEATVATLLHHNADAGLVRGDIDAEFTAHVMVSIAIGGMVRLLRGDFVDAGSRAAYIDSCAGLARSMMMPGSTP